MLEIGVQTKNIIDDKNPYESFKTIKEAGFTSVDFGLNTYLESKYVYRQQVNDFFKKSIKELEEFFTPHKEAAKANNIKIGQMHMPYPLFLPNGTKELNDFLLNDVAVKSMELCKFFECEYIVIHGLSLTRYVGSKDEEWEYTEKLVEFLAPMAKEMGITICLENLYSGSGDHIVEGPCCNVRKNVERIDRINEKHGAEILGFCFDTGHANLLGFDFEDFITTLGHRLKVLHIHDNDGMKDLHQIPFTFTRNLENKPSTDWSGFVKGLRNIGYDKVLSFETAPALTSFPENMKKDALEFIVKIGVYFVNEIEK